MHQLMKLVKKTSRMQIISKMESVKEVLKESKGFKNGVNKETLLEIAYPEKSRIIYKHNKTFIENLEVKEMWEKIRNLMRKMRKNEGTCVISNHEGGGARRYFIVSKKAEAEEFCEMLDPLICGMKKTQQRVRKAAE